MGNTSFAQWIEWAKDFRYVPFLARFDLEDLSLLTEHGTLLSWEPVWEAATSDCAFILESGKNGRFTYIGIDPIDSLQGKGDAALFQLKTWMSAYRAPIIAECHFFQGGCVGYLSYDVAKSLERLPSSATDDLQLPDYYFARYDQIWIIDHENRQLICVVYQDITATSLSLAYEQAQNRSLEMKRCWDRWAQQSFVSGTKRRNFYQDSVRSSGWQNDFEQTNKTSFQKEEFVEAVETIREYIAAGDVFQVNLSVRQSKPLNTNPTDIYEWLRILNPSPYMGYLKFPEFDLVCGSPELLVKLDQGVLTTRPIAGTRPRGTDDQIDEEFAADLILNEKERAEHIMLVDLERNDLGRVAELGSVRVTDLMTIEKYSHVMHIVSQVEARLRNGLDAFDAIAATFPGGTITGAPKIRTMEIIEELEPVTRGPYTGSIGWIDYNGNMELNIIIRTLIAHNGWAHVQAGAGIVIDSDPEKEYMESLNKAKALWTAFHISETLRIGVNNG
jgi:para-aminobenzoate synthetase component 1